jgi:dTDP-4-dehydrorhamnose reductase
MSRTALPARAAGKPFTVAVLGASGLLGRAVADEFARQGDLAAIVTARAPHAPGTRLSNTMPASRTTRQSWTAPSSDENAPSNVGPLQPAAVVALDVLDAAAVERFFHDHAPDAVVVCAAERRPDVCERDPAAARAINVDALARIGSLAARCGAWTLGISTDYVFDGTTPPYREDAPTAPLNAYGRSKVDGERALLAVAPDACVLRLPLLYGPIAGWHESAVTSLAPAIVASASPGAMPASMDAWAIRYPTFTPDVAVVIAQLVQRRSRGETVSGLCHWSAQEPMTKYDIARHLARELRVDARLVAQTAPVDATPRPYDCHLDSARLDAMGIGVRTTFVDGLRQVLRDAPALTG